MIEARTEGAVLTLTLARPDKRNALTEAMLQDLAGQVEASDASAMILTGQGEVFSAGADLDEVRGGTLATSPAWERLSGAVAGFQGLSIAALNGTAAGGSLGMVLACDLRICVPGAGFFYPVMKMGVLPQPSDPGRLARLVGPSRAKRLLLAGARFTAEEALSIGLVDEIVAPGMLLTRAAELAAPASDRGAARVAAIRAMIDRA